MIDLIAKAYKHSYTKPKNDNIIGFTKVLAMDLLEHLATKCIKLTKPERNREIKIVEEPWNQEEELSTYFEYLDYKQERLDKLKITWDDDLNITQEVQKMYNSEAFTEEELIDYEENPEVQKYWTSTMDYFINKNSHRK